MSDSASEVFWDSIQIAGQIIADCVCGRTHFATHSPGEYDEGELEKIQEKARENPDNYWENSMDDSIAIAYLDGITLCYGCPCGRSKRYENFMWGNRALILKYIKKRADKELADATSTREALAGL